MAKITTKITSFADVQKSLQEIEKVLNELTGSVNSSDQNLKSCCCCYRPQGVGFLMENYLFLF